jgi:hypothetical protein
MTLPDARRLLQVVLAVAAPRYPEAQAIRLSNWRQLRNRTARECHARRRARAMRKQLRDTG